MTDKQTQASAGAGNTKKDPDDWVTGDEPMTGAQRSYLKTLSEEAKEPFDDTLTKADASRRIDELQARTGRHPPDKDPAPGGDSTRQDRSKDGGDPAGDRKGSSADSKGSSKAEN